MCIARDACTPAVVQDLTCDELFAGNACGDCVAGSCCDAVEACTADRWCAGILECYLGDCLGGDYRNDEDKACFEEYCAGCLESSTGRELFEALDACATTECMDECE